MDVANNLVEQFGVGPIAENVFGEHYFYSLNRGAFDKVSAKALFEANFADQLFNENALTIVIGTDSGLLPWYVCNKGLPNGARYIFIEPQPVLDALNQHQILDGLDARIACISMEQWEQTIQQFKIIDYFYINAVKSINAFCARDDAGQLYAELSWRVNELLTQLHWYSNAMLGSEAFITQQLNNVVDNKYPSKLLENAFLQNTVVLLAGGPSLDDALPWVYEHRDNIVVFAVSRISKRLLQVGIEPDFIFSVDPGWVSFNVSKDMLQFSDRPILVHSYHAVSVLVSQWQGISLYMGDKFPWKSSLNEANIEAIGPTVTNAALNAAFHFGFKRIILAGVDLCFTKDGYTHARGSNEHQAGPRFNLTSLQVETNGGYMAPTGCDYAAAIDSLSAQARLITSAGRRIINVSEHSAKINFVEYMPLHTVNVDGQCCNVPNITAARLAGRNIGNSYYRRVVNELNRSRFNIAAIQHLAEQARRLNDEMYSEHGVIENYKDKKNLDKIERKLKTEHRHFSKVVKKFGIRRFIGLAKPFSDEDWTADEAKRLGNVFYEAYQEGAKNILQLLDAAISRLAARQEESCASPDFKLLIEQVWRDQSYARVRLWRERYSPQLISPEVNLIFGEFEARVSECVNSDHGFIGYLKSQGGLDFAKQRSGILFRYKKIEELRNLLLGLGKYEPREAAEPYIHLVNGYIAELENDPQAALDEYQKIVDGGGALLEEALARIAGICIQLDDAAMADLSLQCLSQLNSMYLPLYAEMRRLHGDMMAAVDAYNNYINQFPEDNVVQMKLVMLYIDCGIYDAAEMMLDYILRVNPELESALEIKKRLSQMKLSA